MTSKIKAVIWDIGGPLRNSSMQMQKGHEIGAKKANLYEYLKDFLEMKEERAKKTWKLFGLTQNIAKDGDLFNQDDYYRDYKAFMLALYILHLKRMPIDRILEVKKPVDMLSHLIENYFNALNGMKPRIFEAGIESKKAFKSEEALKYTRVSNGAIEAVEYIKEKNITQGIITSAPKGSTEHWISTYVESKTGEVFDRNYVIEGVVNKVDAFIDIAKKLGINKEKEEKLVYIADTASDIRAVGHAIKELGQIYILIMVKNGMGVESEWELARSEFGVFNEQNYIDAENAFEGIKRIL